MLEQEESEHDIIGIYQHWILGGKEDQEIPDFIPQFCASLKLICTFCKGK